MVFRLASHPVVVKLAPKGSPHPAVERTVAVVRWLMDQGFPTVALHPVAQPVIVGGRHAATFWTYLPQSADASITAADLASPLRILHSLVS